MRKVYLLFVITFVFCFFVFFTFKKHESFGEKNIQFVIDKPFLIVVKQLANKNSLEKMAEENNAAIVGKYWEEFDIKVPQRILKLKEYKMNGVLKFKVLKNDKDLGELLLSFVQKMQLDKNQLTVETNLEKPQKSIVRCSKKIKINPQDDSKTVVFLKSEIAVQKSIPFFLVELMNKKVQESAEEDLEKLKDNIFSVAGPTIKIERF